MREPDLQVDDWCLDDGESYHAQAPETFAIPAFAKRQALQPGDYAKLLFRIAVENGDEVGYAVERMWVLVRERCDSGYLGVLDNEPQSVDENDVLWVGTELPFQARHVIDIVERDADSIALAAATPRVRWAQ